MDPGEKDGSRNDDALGQILNSLQGKGSSSLTPKSNNNGSHPKTEMEQYQKAMMEQRIQMKTFLEESKEMKKEISILQTKSKKSDSEIESLRSLLASEREGKAVLEAIINSLRDMLQNTVEAVRSRLEATEESVRVLRKEASKVNEAIEAISPQIEVRFIGVNENIQRVKESVEKSDKRTQSNLEDSQLNFSKVDGCHGRLRDELQNIKSEMKELERRMESEIQRTVTESEKNQSRIADEIQQQNLQLQHASERDGKALLDATINSHNVAIQNMIVAARSRLAATEDSIKVINDIQRVNESMEASKKRMQPEVQFTVTKADKNQSGVTDEIQKRMLELRQRREVRLTLATAKGGDGSENNLPIITISDEEEMEEEAVPQDPFILSSGAGKYKAASADGPQIGSGNKKNSDPPSATTPCTTTTIQNQNSLDRIKTEHLFFSNGGQVKKVEETSKARPLASSTPKPSTSKSTRVAKKKTCRHHTRSLLRPMLCVCGRPLNKCRFASKV